MDARNLLTELKRRNVYKVAAAYAVVAWLLVQVSTQVFPFFEIPNWAVRLIVLLVVVGFPIALIAAWAFELTPQGIVRTEVADETAPRAARRGSVYGPWIYVVLFGAMFSVALFLFGRYTGSRPVQPIAERSAASSTSLSAKSIAVLPFENLSDDKANAYFAEGIQDEILTRLAKVADLKVISRTSTQRFKSTPSDLRDIAKQLGVMNVLEGSVQKSNDQVRVNVQLINAMTDAHLWAEIYDRKLTDLFTVESDIAKTIADTLQARLTGSEQKAIASRPTENPEAYQLYLQGRFFWNKRTSADLRKSIDLFKAAIEKDPDYALAYAAAAQSWLLLPAYDGGAPNESFPQAEVMAKKALALDPSSSDAQTAVAAVKELYEFDQPASIAGFERAIKLNPNDATAHHWLGNHPLTSTGDLDRAEAEIKRARELDPLSLIINSNIGYTLNLAGRFDEAILQLRKTVELDPNFYYARLNLAEALELKGSVDDAIAEYKKTIALTDDSAPVAYLGHAYGNSGRKQEANLILQQLLERRAQRYIPAYFLAVVYLGLADRNQALHWLEEGFRDRDGFNMGPIRVDPFLKPLHGDSRFEALAEKIVPAAQFHAAVATK